MLKPLSCISFCFLTVLISGFTHKGKRAVNNDLLKNYVQLNDRLFINKFETSNADYHVFLSYLNANGNKDAYRAALPDTALWDKGMNKTNPFKVFYFSHPAFKDYPLVAVSYANSIAYCEWLTARYHMDPLRKYKKVKFRLPTEQEWMDAASGGDESRIYPWKGTSMTIKKGSWRGMKYCNYLVTNDSYVTKSDNTKTFILIRKGENQTTFSPVKSYSPNDIGLFNCSGNVAEMVAEKGWAKGGSYNDPGYDVRIASKKQFARAATDIGFRVAMEIIEP